MILCVSASTNPALDALGNTGLNSDQYYYQQSSISGVVVPPVWLQGREDWIHALSKPLVGLWWWWWGGGGGRGFSWSTPILLCGHLFVSLPPSPLFFLLSWSILACSTSFHYIKHSPSSRSPSKSTLPSWGGGGGMGMGIWGLG